MKKLTRFAALLMIICLLFSTAAFAAEGDTDEGTAEPVERIDGRWDRGCRQMPLAPGHETEIVTLDEVAWNSGEYSGTPSPAKIPSNMPHFNTPKELPLLILVLGFDNIHYEDDLDWAAHVFEGSDSLAQYYKDMSFNQFQFVPARETSAYGVGGNHNREDAVNDGVVHIETGTLHDAWAYDTDEVMTTYVQMLVDAIRAADDYVDFASFDANRDGQLTNDEFALGVVVAGYEGAADQDCTEGEDYYLWSFKSDLSSGWWYYFSDQYPVKSDFIPSPDGVVVNDYITIPEQLDPGRQEPISVLAHELGHYLGLPDLYTTDYDYDALWGAYDVGYLSVMCSGSWGWDPYSGEYKPVAFDAWSRSCLGWVTPQTVSNGEYDVISDKGAYNVLRVETGVEGDYYLLETREYSGWDAGLDISYGDGFWSGYCYADYAPNGGLICWHIDDSVYDEYADVNEVNNTYHRPAVMPLYPEETSSGAVTFTGEIDFFEGTAQPFFTYGIWKSRYQKSLGNGLEFPTYNGSDKFADRAPCGTVMTILGDVTHGVRVRFDLLERIAGPNRYSTAMKAAESYMRREDISKLDTVIIASGNDYADALAGSYLAVIKDAPILLVNDATASSVAEFVYDRLASNGTVYILGGTGAVSARFENALKSLGFSGGTIKRLAGANRYSTNIAILKEAGYDKKDILVCYGLDYADSLSASAVGKPIFLANKTLTPDQIEFLESEGARFENVYVIGGTGVISAALAEEVTGYIAEDYERVSGVNRFSTSVAVAEKFFDDAATDNVFLAYANDYPDGLAGGPVAWLDDAPMLLVTDTRYTEAAAYAQKVGAVSCVMMGGAARIPTATALSILGK